MSEIIDLLYTKYIKTYKDKNTGKTIEEETQCLNVIDIVDHHFEDDEDYDWYCDCVIFNLFYACKNANHYCPSGAYSCGRERFQLLSIRKKDNDQYLYLDQGNVNVKTI